MKILWRKGTSQEDRMHAALNPENLDLMGLDVEDWVFFAHNFARFIPFLSSSGSTSAIQNWQVFFSDLVELEEMPSKGTEAYVNLERSLREKLAHFSNSGDLAPQLGLLIAFLKLLGYSRERLNGITERHLDFYYRSVLNIPKNPARPDEAFLVLEMAKNLPVHLPEGTLFDGGKDELGIARHYRSLRDFFPNLAEVAVLKNRYVDDSGKQIRISQIADSLDGNGSSFSSENQGWWPFGHSGNSQESPALQSATFGFGVSAATLWSANTADRYFKFEFEFKQNLSFSGDPSDIVDLFSCHCTTEKGWVVLSPSNHPEMGMSCSVSGKKISIVLHLDKEQPSLLGQQEKIHGSVTGSGAPLVWFDLKCTTKKAYHWIKGLSETPLKNIRINAKYKGIRQAVLESDLGILNPDKPFQPFGSIPKKGSSFYIKYPDWERKKPSKVQLIGKWSNTPIGFKEWYFGYRDLGGDYLSKDSFLAQHFTPVVNLSQPIKFLLWESGGLKTPLLKSQIKVNTDPSNLIVEDNNHFKATISIADNQDWTDYQVGLPLFVGDSGDFTFEAAISPKAGKTNISAGGGIKVTILQSFLHDLFPRLYALAMSSDQPETPIPNEPYTPLLESLEISFETDETYDLNSGNNGDLELLYRDDFGHFDQANDTKSVDFQSAEENYLLAYPGEGGELFIGIKKLLKDQQLSLLFQVLEGSENPSNASFTQETALKWSVLAGNSWKLLTKEHLVSNQTENFLRSGILVLNLPKEAFEAHSRMQDDLLWIRVRSSKAFDASSRMLSVYAQAVKTRFEDRRNELGHLQDGLPAGSISKMVERKAGVKTVFQPFNSYGGKAPETDAAFHTRVSERLRHKNRAVSLWDFEHLVLEEFPEVYKVKCLNHTCPTSFLSPGKVLVIVVPDTVNKNLFDVFKPALSSAKLEQIESFLSEKISPQVELKVINPLYEEIKIKVQVQFKEGLDAAFYRNQMEQDLILFLSPWTSGDKQAIDFSSFINKSGLIYFIEKLDYVDFIQQPILFKNEIEVKDNVFPKSPKHILVSAGSHDISLYENT
ncbi:baseplate J/gp47 family protein [Cyclobacterium jeungdonense]|uniref:Baseplate J/gp47 family protein n=1 Tax=Cyclobacterium jeungdonense TaxID=708087 RepID=A0ABT8CB00_9BACT|nr:baseplate J/gp47 family protein [Cyclobacterium jeungdonense]MDN3689964.1 baseplate J/gp47 family protein [Cyclobacterium jeungdonense]